MTWVDVLMSLSPAEARSGLVATSMFAVLAGNGAARFRQILEIDTRRLCRVDGRFQNRAQKTVTQNRAVFGASLTE